MNVHRFFVGLAVIGSTILLSSVHDSLMAGEQEMVYSGPQVGEPLVPFQVLSVLGDSSGTEVDPIAIAGGRPTLLVFVHKLTRPGMALTRALTSYAHSQIEHGAVAAIIWLDDDKAKAEAYLTRAKQSLNFSVPVGISIDGGEGPGAYGLNRNVELTILVAKDSVVQANFALVQPSVTEAASIASELAKLIEQPIPDQDQMEQHAYPGGGMMTRRMRSQRGMKSPGGDAKSGTDDLRTRMRRLVASDLNDDNLQKAVDNISAFVGDDPQRKTQLSRMIHAILERNMGNAKVQSALKKWQQDLPSVE